MLTILNSYKKGFSKETIIAPTFMIQSGFFRNRTEQPNPIKNPIRNEIVELNNIQLDIKHGALIFSEMLKIHQHTALKKENEQTITLKFNSCADELVRACKVKSNYTITQISEALKLFSTDLAPSKVISVISLKDNKRETFSIFSKLKLNQKNKTISFVFSNDFINFLNKEECSITYIQVDEFIKVASNKTGGSLFFMIQSISNIKKEKFFATKYLINALGIYKNCNKLLNNAFENLKDKGFLNFEKIVTAKPLAGNKWLKWSIYKIQNIAKKVVESTAIKTLKKVPKKIEINSKLMNTAKGREIFNSLINGKSDEDIAFDVFNTDYLQYAKEGLKELVKVKY
jgi:hypothetical protein